MCEASYAGVSLHGMPIQCELYFTVTAAVHQHSQLFEKLPSDIDEELCSDLFRRDYSQSVSSGSTLLRGRTAVREDDRGEAKHIKITGHACLGVCFSLKVDVETMTASI